MIDEMTERSARPEHGLPFAKGQSGKPRRSPVRLAQQGDDDGCPKGCRQTRPRPWPP